VDVSVDVVELYNDRKKIIIRAAIYFLILFE